MTATATAPHPTLDEASLGRSAALLEKVLFEVKRVVVGQDRFLERVLIALLAQGHLLVEGVPGLAKTLTVKTLARALDCRFGRVQFTPDLMPADLVGTRIYHPHSGEFSTALGPVFTNLLLADEINRAPAKVQSALLEVMQERQVTIAGHTHTVPAPFVVMATQNPIETEGTYALPEAQVDRFMMKVLIDYPSEGEEFVVIERALAAPPEVQAVLSPDQLATMQAQVQQVYVDPGLIHHVVRLVTATRDASLLAQARLTGLLSFGASPRASIALVQAARALALLRGRGYVVADDLNDLALDVLRHRVVLSYDALAQGLTADAVLMRLLQAVPSRAAPADADAA
ncbi:ATPase [Comamonas serinivorans]|uniref:ATPase n=1 Tax=Comamonas serinivorans TaxID=1082851 RepID=A0A1Y0EL99_9BURK|nr:MoxR family ATPase [Comamonas serinivorans]ARU04414.1 ATPase [Comamonas serinivorans]